MNPNLTIGYLASQATQQQVERGAVRGWIADEAAAQRETRRPAPVDTLMRWTAAISAATGRAQRRVTGLFVPAVTASRRLDRVG